MQRSYIFVQVKSLIYFFTGSLIIWAGPTDYMEEDMWTNPYTKYDSNIWLSPHPLSPSLTLSHPLSPSLTLSPPLSSSLNKKLFLNLVYQKIQNQKTLFIKKFVWTLKNFPILKYRVIFRKFKFLYFTTLFIKKILLNQMMLVLLQWTITN